MLVLELAVERQVAVVDPDDEAWSAVVILSFIVEEVCTGLEIESGVVDDSPLSGMV